MSESVSASSRIVTTAPVNVTVNSFAEDLFGYMWMGTKRGVIRYDGDKYLRYLHNVNAENSIPSNIITTLFCDSRGTMWVGTVGGVARQNNMDEFCPVEFEYPEGRSESVFEFFESPDGKVYMSTADLLQVYDPQQNKFVSCMLFDNGKALTSFKIDSKGKLWYLSEGIVRSKPSPESDSHGTVLDIAGTNVSQMILLENNVLCTMNNKGFLIWSTELNIIVHDGLLKGYPNLRPENIQSIYPGASTTFYMITTKNEVWMYDYSTGVAVMIDAPASTSTLYLDRHEKLWLGTTDNGFDTVNASDIGDGSPTRLANLYRGVAIQSMYAVPDGRIIINSADYGLYFFTPELGHLAAIEFQKYSTQKPLAVYMDSEDRLWVGTSDKCHVFRLNGYSEKDAYSGTFFLKELGVFNIDSPTMFQEDADGNVWLATSSHSLYVCRRGTSKLEKLTLDVVSGYMYFPQLVKARDGIMYFPAFHYGIYAIDPVTFEFKLYASVFDKLRSNFLPICMIEASDGKFWIGTSTEGLVTYDPSTSSWSHVEEVDCESINTIVEYPDGHLWIGTVDGFYTYDIKTNYAVHYTQNERITIGEISRHSTVVMENGGILFGGREGVFFFNTNNSTNQQKIDLYFDDIYINGNRVAPSEKECIDKEMRFSPDVTLKKDMGSVSFTFSTPSISSDMVEYLYMLEGLDNDWQKPVSKNTIQYSHIPEGHFKLKLVAKNKFSGSAVGSKEIKIRVLSPLLTSRFAFGFIYPLLILAILLLFIHMYLRDRKNRLYRERIIREKEHEENLNKMNVSFFTNMSHEFRTPLTLIQGPMDELSEVIEDTPYNRGLISTVKRSVDRMLHLVDQVMDFSKLETDALNLSLCECNISNLFHGIVAPFAYSCSRKDIKFEVSDNCEGVKGFVDSDKFEKILNNLLSNAVKYTPGGAGSIIRVSLNITDYESASRLFRSEIQSKSQSYLLVSVDDTGLGIPQEMLEEVFERYRRISTPEADKQFGSGIGLYYVRRLADLHHGIVEASKSTSLSGSCFRVLIPMDKEEYDGEIFVTGTPADILRENYYDAEDREHSESGRPQILLVEDDIDVASYVSSLLGKYYDVKVKYSADEACEEIRFKCPDMLITDVMLPGTMDGLMLCKFIKENIETSHVPVMVLSAKSTLEDQIKGIETGADSYVTKPVAPAYLLTLTKTILTNREKLRTRIQETTDVDEISEPSLAPQDRLFLESMYDIMEKQLSNNELNVDMMAESLKISRAKLYYKFKGLVNETPNSFFKKYKLNRAAELLRSGKYNVSEVSDMTGFSSLSYFSVSFKKQFGVNPSDFS